MSQSKNHKWALFYLEKLKWSIIPINPRGKKPLIKWKEFQKRLPTPEEINKWWTETPDANIGLVTGSISGISVIDLDEYKAPGTVAYMQEVYYTIRADIGYYRPWDDCYSSRTARGGYHWFFKYHPALISRQAIPNVDVKSEGGYVLLPPSVIPGTGDYNWIRSPWKGNETRITVECPEMYVDIFTENPTRDFGEGVISQETESTTPLHSNDSIGLQGESTTALQDESTKRHTESTSVTDKGFANRIISFQEGGRDETLFHIANCLFRGGMSANNVRKVLRELGRMVCHPPFPDADTKFASALTRQEERERPLTEEIEDWIAGQTGNWSVQELDQDLNLRDKADKKNRRQIIYRLKKQGHIEQSNGRAGVYRRVLGEMETIDFRNVDMDNTYDDFVWPLGLESYYRLMRKNIVIVSGAPDAGKTGMLLKLTDMNMDNYPINYFSSEMGSLEFRSRLDLFPHRSIKDWKFNAFERDANFADVIRPDEVNIIDFLEMYDNFYQIGGHIKDIFNKLHKGVAIIAIQKNPGVENPLGGNRAREKARMVINLDRVKLTEGIYSNVLKITKCKNWANTLINPVGRYIYFDMTDGCNFLPRGEWHREK